MTSPEIRSITKDPRTQNAFSSHYIQSKAAANMFLWFFLLKKAVEHFFFN